MDDGKADSTLLFNIITILLTKSKYSSRGECREFSSSLFLRPSVYSSSTTFSFLPFLKSTAPFNTPRTSNSYKCSIHPTVASHPQNKWISDSLACRLTQKVKETRNTHEQVVIRFHLVIRMICAECMRPYAKNNHGRKGGCTIRSRVIRLIAL